MLADEIVSGLDVSSKAQILTLLEQLRTELRLTVAFISHDLSVVRRLCDRVIVMRGGEILENRPTAELFDAPAASLHRGAEGGDPAAGGRSRLARGRLRGRDNGAPSLVALARIV